MESQTGGLRETTTVPIRAIARNIAFPQCTMGLSIEIGEENFAKVNGWVFLTFQPKMIISICTGVKLQIFYQKNNVHMSVMQNILYFCKKHE